MMRLVSCVAFMALSACVVADELVLMDIKPVSASSAKFASVNDKHSLHSAIEVEASTYKVLANTVYRFDALRRPHLGKIALRQAITILTETKPKVEELQRDLILLKAITQEIQHTFDTKAFGSFVSEIALIKKDTNDLLKHLNELLEEFDCKFKRKCFDDDLKAAQNALFQKITIMVDIEQKCTMFTQECSEKYKVLQGKFDDFQTEKIRALYTAFDTVCDGKCFPTPKQREQSSKELLEFDTKVKGWVLTMKAKLKKLVENKLNDLNDQFLQDCKDLNNLKISAKKQQLNVPFLNGMVTELGTLLAITNKLHDDFVEVFDLLVFLEDILTDDIFTDCFKRASTMYYLINGFKIQINDCIASTKKQVLVAQAGFNVTIATAQFNKVKETFNKESEALGQSLKVQSCDEVTILSDSFSDYKASLTKSKAGYEFLKNRFLQADVKDCVPVLVQGQVTVGLGELENLELEVEQYLCFFDIFKDVFCH
ncbi:uncharacterized protein [Clytia hemisphaerica]|uniref:Uncharacterized protein n=1 Tax=Clytia hemisphaerica TaxID=252671 RepID=A0A7M5XBY7_9CNID|eukprot:TCONS_00034231-protein